MKHLEPDAFAGLGNLRVLRMEENGLRSLAHFDALVSLRALHLGGNRVGEVSELEKLAPLAELGELTLAGNPVTRKQVYRPMALRHCEKAHTLDGRAVTALEREHVEYLFSPVDGAGAASSDGAYGGDDPGSEGGNFIVASAVADAEYWRSAGTPRRRERRFSRKSSVPRFPESAFCLAARPRQTPRRASAAALPPRSSQHPEQRRLLARAATRRARRGENDAADRHPPREQTRSPARARLGSAPRSPSPARRCWRRLPARPAARSRAARRG